MRSCRVLGIVHCTRWERDKVPVLCCAPARPGLKWLRPGSARSEIEFQVHPTTREEKRKIKSWLALQLGSNDQQSPSGNPLSSSPLYTLRPPPGPARHGAPTTVQKCANHFLLLLLSKEKRREDRLMQDAPDSSPILSTRARLELNKNLYSLLLLSFFLSGEKLRTVEERRKKMTSSKRREKKRGETLFLQSRGIKKGPNHFQLGTRPVNLLLLAQWWHCVCVCLLLLLKKLRNKQLRKRQPVVKGCNKNNKKRVGEIQYKQIGSDWVDCLHSSGRM